MAPPGERGGRGLDLHMLAGASGHETTAKWPTSHHILRRTGPASLEKSERPLRCADSARVKQHLQTCRSDMLSRHGRRILEDDQERRAPSRLKR